MSLLTYLKSYENVAIYGAGEVAAYLCGLLKKKNINVTYFVVSDVSHKEEKDGIRICTVHSWAKTRDKHEGILIGVSEQYRREIERNLKANGINDYFFVRDENMQELKRNIEPTIPENFLKQAEPVSRIFGYDRGKSICRAYIEKFFSEVEQYVPKKPEVMLEVGDSRYSNMLFPNDDVQKEVLMYQSGMDLTDADTLPVSKYDVFIATQVFNFIYDLKAAIQNSYKLLKYGGIMFGTVSALISPVSLSDMKNYGHYWGFTDLCIKKLLGEGFGNENVEVYNYGNALSATAFIQGLAYEDIENKTFLNDNDSQYAILIGFVARKVKKDA